jgi:hypothetical protein
MRTIIGAIILAVGLGLASVSGAVGAPFGSGGGVASSVEKVVEQVQ